MCRKANTMGMWLIHLKNSLLRCKRVSVEYICHARRLAARQAVHDG